MVALDYRALAVTLKPSLMCHYHGEIQSKIALHVDVCFFSKFVMLGCVLHRPSPSCRRVWSLPALKGRPERGAWLCLDCHAKQGSQGLVGKLILQ